jgi:predicted transcriptional regulator
MTGVFMVKHTTHTPRDGSGFVHYKEGCLCHYCPHYLKCRLSVEVVAVGEYQSKAIERDNRDDKSHDKKAWRPTESSEATKKVIELLRQHPEGLTVRQISILTGISARHVYRIVKALHAQGLLKKLWELRREKIITTDKRHIETTEIAHRYAIANTAKEERR